MKKHTLAVLIASLLIAVNSFAQTKPLAGDYLSVPGPVLFQGHEYYLVWSSHPSATYYKLEYVAKGQSVERFKTMLLLEVLTGDVKVKEVVANKLNELKQMKASNPLVNYEMFQKDGEYIIDFVLTANSADGNSTEVVEHNVYRYKSLAAQPGLVLFAISNRAYGKDTARFLTELKTSRSLAVNAVAKFSIPAVKIKK